MAVLELKNIRKSYFLGKEEFPVLKGIDLEFERGDFVSLLGESGGGKSTLMNIIGGLDRKYEGDVIVDGLAQKTKKEKDMDAYRRDTIGFIFQSFNLVSYLSVLDNILISLKMTSLSDKERHERAIELTKQVGLYEHRKKNPSQLSGGQKQRVAIARTLAINPKILLLDEPFSNLDINLRNEMREFVLNLQKKLNITTILVTHDKEEALIMSDKIAVMVNGKIEQFDKPEILYQKPRTKSVANIFGERNYIKGKIENEVFKSNILYIDAKGYNNLDIVEAMIPKECIKLYSSNYNDGINGYIQRKQYVGDKTFYDININGEVLKCTSISNEYNQGDCVKICVDRDNIVFFPL